MDKRWLQIKGDPSVRRFLFEQKREGSLFDRRIDELMGVVENFLTMRGVFHAKIHFSSTQLTCWFYNDPYRYQVFVGEEIFQPGFLEQFAPAVCAERPQIAPSEVHNILQEFRRMRLTDETVYLRNASINLINGLIGMTFSCDGSHYIPYEEFYETLKTL
jgi:hypothetical protein